MLLLFPDMCGLLVSWSLGVVGQVLGLIVVASVRVGVGRARRPSSRAGVTRRPSLSWCSVSLSDGVSSTGEFAQQIVSGSAGSSQLLESKNGSEDESELSDDQSLGGQQGDSAEQKWGEGEELGSNGQDDGSGQLLDLATACTDGRQKS